MTLWAFGVHVSRALRFSAVSVAALYILPGIVGALVSVNLSTDVPSVGAPAAVCGLIGALPLHFFKARKQTVGTSGPWNADEAHILHRTNKAGLGHQPMSQRASGQITKCRTLPW